MVAVPAGEAREEVVERVDRAADDGLPPASRSRSTRSTSAPVGDEQHRVTGDIRGIAVE